MFNEPVVRIILVGDSGTGKTSIIRKYTDDDFSYDTSTTLGNYFNKLINDKRCWFQTKVI